MKEKNSLQPWNGLIPGQFQYADPAGLLVDPEGNIFYTGADGLPALWCSARSLFNHLDRLWNVTQGKAVVNLWYVSMTGRNWRGGKDLIFFYVLLLPFLIVWDASGATLKRKRRRR